MATRIQRSRGASPAKKATIHQTEGAGRSKVRRRFFGMTKADEREVFQRLVRFVERSIRR